MNEQDKAEAARAIGMMLAAFPSSQSSISAESAKVYIWAVEDVSLEAVKRACKLVVRGETGAKNKGFAPSVPEFLDVVQGCQRELDLEARHSRYVFVEEGSQLWRQMLAHRGRGSLPTYDRAGRKGWNFPREDVAKASQLVLPPPLTEAQMEANRARLALAGGHYWSVGDREGDEAAA